MPIYKTSRGLVRSCDGCEEWSDKLMGKRRERNKKKMMMKKLRKLDETVLQEDRNKVKGGVHDDVDDRFLGRSMLR